MRKPTVGDLRRLRRGLATVVPLLVMTVGVVYILFNLTSLQAPAAPSSQGVFEQLLRTPEMILATRLLALALAFYAASSVLALALQGRWMTKAGKEGVEADPARPLDDLQGATDDLEKRLTALEDGLRLATSKLEKRLDSQKEGLELIAKVILEPVDREPVPNPPANG